LVRQATRTVAP